jgi:hypothetical protein
VENRGAGGQIAQQRIFYPERERKTPPIRTNSINLKAIFYFI